MVKNILLALDEKLLNRLDDFAEKYSFNRVQAIRYILKVFLDDFDKKLM